MRIGLTRTARPSSRWLMPASIRAATRSPASLVRSCRLRRSPMVELGSRTPTGARCRTTLRRRLRRV